MTYGLATVFHQVVESAVLVSGDRFVLLARWGEERALPELLADWPNALGRFTEVIPRDFRIVMEAKAKAEADGLADNEIATAMMDALHG